MTAAQLVVSQSAPSVCEREPAHRLDALRRAIEHAAHLLPAQGPITVFIHHNTLHAFEDKPFDEAVKEGWRTFGCQPYLPEERYREKLARRRILPDDLLAVLRKDLQGRADEQPVPGLGTRLQLRMAMLQYPLRLVPTPELRWFVAETDAMRRFRPELPPQMRERLIEETQRWILRDVRAVDEAGQPLVRDRRLHGLLAGLFERYGESKFADWSDSTWEAFGLNALWRICREGLHGVKPSAAAADRPARHRDLLLAASGEDSDRLVQEVLIPFCAAFLDQGFAVWALPGRELGYFKSFCCVYGTSGTPVAEWLKPLAAELKRLQAAHTSPLESIAESLELLGVGEAEWPEYISMSLLALRGWAGMIRQVEIRGDRVALPVPADSLLEYLAIRLLLDRLAIGHIARTEIGYTGRLNELRNTLGRSVPKPETAGVDQRAFLVFQLAQALGWLPAELHRLDKAQWTTLIGEIEEFSGIERRRIFHLAFERRYRIQALDALSAHSRRKATVPPAPRFQTMHCLDEREESFRRHLEEIAPDVETFGAAGFYNVAMYYQGAADAHFVPLCPVVIRPQHWVVEDVVYSFEEAHRRRAKTRRALGKASHQFHLGSRTFAGGTLLAAGVGVLASIPLVARILCPRLTARIRRMFGQLVAPPPITQLRLERATANPGAENGKLGYSVAEMAECGESLLRDIGLTTGFSRMIFILGHGSNSLNNPHNSAYNCGACGGSAGGPNGRAMARILNDFRVRERLSRRGIRVPDETVFVGGLHNTCDDSVTLFDLDDVPHSHRADLDAARNDIEQACNRNAHERCRRFESAPHALSFAEARRHVEARAEDLAQTRPELGHATNALCIVGRRQRTRGLFLDRRAFLVSYDPAQDDADNSILLRLLQAAVPVCAGINLEYYFSRVDSTGWGCGSKLPHNVASLLGVMDGAASDLRTGLPWQMAEVHEPVRLLFVVETTPQAMLSIMERDKAIGRTCRNGWIQLVVLDPNSPTLQVFRGGTFHPFEPGARELPVAATSTDWYRGWRDHLEFAEIAEPRRDSLTSKAGTS